ncbi:MAG: oligosaccharide flippase family protein, partial [Phycisphaerae bacterium]
MFDKSLKAISNKISVVRGNNLKARSARGAISLGIGSILERGLRLVRNMILARLLVPDEFGLMAIVLAAATTFEAFTEVGVKQSVIHNKKGDETEYLNVAWWFQAVRGLALFVVGFIIAPWIGAFYNNPGLLPLLRVSFIAILFNGFMSPRVYVLEKKIQFGKYV